jgi:L-ascorbate metabolism protein UlaG (beta-lactamase superfamily)
MSEKLGVRIKWLGCACFEMDFGGLTVVNDPWITPNEATELTWEAVEKCDYITLTHGHFDHTIDIPVLMEKFGARVLCGEFTSVPLLRWTNANPMSIYPMVPNLELDFDDVKIKALYGRHGPLPGAAAERMEKHKAAPYNEGDPNLIELGFWGDFEYRNFLYTMPNGTKVMICGSKLHRDQQNILREVKPDILLLQVVGVNGAARTAALIKEIGCKVVIPFHFDFPNSYMGKVDELSGALKELAPEVEYIVPEYGQWIEL